MTTAEQLLHILYMTPGQAQERLQLTEPDARLNLGVTAFNRQTGEGTIIINSLLPPSIQSAIEEQERIQYQMMYAYINSSPGRNVEDIMPHAHYAGLDAGVQKAKELGVLDEYLCIRGQGETEESIRNAPRP